MTRAFRVAGAILLALAVLYLMSVVTYAVGHARALQ